MPSINQSSVALPDFRNFGVWLRILVIVNLAGLAAALLRASAVRGIWPALLDDATLLQPTLLGCLVLLWGANGLLQRLPYYGGVAATLLILLVTTTLAHQAGLKIFGDMGTLQRHWLLALMVGATLLAYFNLRSRALSPAITEARLQALQARIRPHFLFNSINAVLSLIRADPKRAETALEDLADLFRVAMTESRQLVPLGEEVKLCRQYLELEQLRLGDRLQVEWHIEKMPPDALIPPLLLQPLLENAVYHGIEPSAQPGVVSVDIYLARNEVHAVLRNPYQPQGEHHAGNKMALANIRERLDLHFDAVASLETTVTDNIYRVHIVIPYLTNRGA